MYFNLTFVKFAIIKCIIKITKMCIFNEVYINLMHPSCNFNRSTINIGTFGRC